jgi:uncharacterized damage-inducible protein DinB
MNSMNKSALIVLHDYNNCANGLVLQTAAKMDTTALTAQSSPSHGCVQSLLIHMLTTEFFFLARSEGKPVHPKNAPTAQLSMSEIVLSFDQVAEERKKYLEWVTDEKLLEIIEVPIGGHPFQLARWQLLTQAFLHSAHHRGELSIVMTGLGHPLPTLDIILPFIEQNGQHWPSE